MSFYFTVLFLINGMNVSSFSLKDLDGNTVSLDSVLQKGSVVLDFWATWCTYCDEQLDLLQDIYDEFKDEGITVLALTWDTPKSISKIEPLVKSRGWNFPILFDSDKKVGRMFSVVFLPTTFIISQDREVVYKKVGYNPREKEEIKKIIEELLQKKLKEAK